MKLLAQKQMVLLNKKWKYEKQSSAILKPRIFRLYRQKQLFLVSAFFIFIFLLIIFRNKPKHVTETSKVSFQVNEKSDSLSQQEYEPVKSFTNTRSIKIEPEIEEIALIFDEGRKSNALATIQSIHYYRNTKSSQITFHIVAPISLHYELATKLENFTAHLYDYEQCTQFARRVNAFSNRKIHTSAHCKVFLADILTRTHKVLYVDTDVAAIQSISPCVNSKPPQDVAATALIGMAVDMGDVCQLYPNRCWPIGLEWLVPKGTVCGNVPERFNKKRGNTSITCPAPLQPETYQMNGGVLLLHLAKMRETNFTEKYVNFVVNRAKSLNFKIAQWGEQDYLNAYFQYEPKSIFSLPCGCNYQYTGVRRSLKCAQQPLYLAHGWTKALSTPTNDPFTRLFYSFKTDKVLDAAAHHTENTVRQSRSLRVSPGVSFSLEYPLGQYENGSPKFRPCTNCTLQSFDGCNKSALSLSLYGEPVIILSRASDSNRFLKLFKSSINSQMYPSNMRYFNSVHEIPSTFNGWILLLDHQYVFLDNRAISFIMASVTSHNFLYYWSTVLEPDAGSTISIPGDKRWPSTPIALLHSTVFNNNIRSIYHDSPAAVSEELTKLPAQFLPKQYTALHPLYGASSVEKITVIITSVGFDSGFRLQWLRKNVEYLASGELAYLIDRVLVVWNCPNSAADFLTNNTSSRLKVLPMKVNSLNNRWTETLPYIRTEAVLNFDDDVFVTESALLCMMGYFLRQPLRPIGPFVRRHNNVTNEYYMDEIINGEEYSIILPRVLLLNRKYLQLYKQEYTGAMTAYVDTQEAHCDDIALNALFARNKVTPLRILLPPDSLVDFFTSCYSQYPQETGGLALHKNRQSLRSQCLSHILNQTLVSFTYTRDLAECAVQSSLLGYSTRPISQNSFKAMRQHVPCTVVV